MGLMTSPFYRSENQGTEQVRKCPGRISQGLVVFRKTPAGCWDLVGVQRRETIIIAPDTVHQELGQELMRTPGTRQGA